MDGRTDARTDGWMDRCMDGCIDGWMDSLLKMSKPRKTVLSPEDPFENIESILI